MKSYCYKQLILNQESRKAGRFVYEEWSVTIGRNEIYIIYLTMKSIYNLCITIIKNEIIYVQQYYSSEKYKKILYKKFAKI